MAVTREDLWRLRSYNERLRSLERQKEQLRDAVTNMTQRLTGMPSGGDGHDRMMAFVARLDELEARYADLIAEQAEARLQVERALLLLPEQQERVLRLRYIEGLSWKKIGKIMHYDVSTLIRKHKNALKKLE